MSNVVIFGAPHSGKTTLLGYISTAMLRHPKFNEEILMKLKLIKKLNLEDDFKIGDPYNPVYMRKDIILPSFVSLDRDELCKFVGKDTIGTTKRIHRKQLSICVSERSAIETQQDENENMSCTFVDLPGFRQRISDKYKGFFEGDIGLAVLDIGEILKLTKALEESNLGIQNQDEIEKQERRLFEPIRIWCDYRSAERLVIVISKIDQVLYHGTNQEEDISKRLKLIEEAVDCIRIYIDQFEGNAKIPVVPIAIWITSEENYKKKSRMRVFFHRKEENIYADPEGINLPGDGTLISCLKKLLNPYIEGENRAFSMASVERPMQAKVNYTRKTALQIRTIHGTLRNTDSVFLGPVFDKSTGDVCCVKCTISSLKADGIKFPLSDPKNRKKNESETLSMLLEGNVGGVIFKSIADCDGRNSQRYILSSETSESTLKILKSTILFTGECVQGDMIVIEICKKDYIMINGEVDDLYTCILKSLMPYDELVLFWYGKKVMVKVAEIGFDENKLCMSLIRSFEQKKSIPYFILPCNENGAIKYSDNVLLAIPESHYLFKTYSGEPIYTYISAAVTEIKNSKDFNTIWIQGRMEMGLSELLKGKVCFESMKENERENIKIPIKTHMEDSMRFILSQVNKNLRKTFNRAIYQKLGGVEMRLEDTLVNANQNLSQMSTANSSNH